MRFITTTALLLSALSVLAADFDVRDEAEFKKIVPDGAKVEKLAGGFRFVEGPVWLKDDSGILVFSDIPANELKKWTPSGGVTTFRQPSQKANGNTVDLQGNLVSAEHWGRRVSRTVSGGIETVVDNWEGKKFNSPNDVVVKSDETYWFTDPDYGLEGRMREIEGNYVYRHDPKSQKTTVLIKDFDKPNGLCFSPDEKRLYVADSGRPRHIRVFDVGADGNVSEGKVFCQIDKGGPDGIRADSEGRVFSSAGDGVHIFTPEGKLIGKILCPEAPANLCFGGKDFKTLYITARTSLYKIDLNVKGHLPKAQ